MMTSCYAAMKVSRFSIQRLYSQLIYSTPLPLDDPEKAHVTVMYSANAGIKVPASTVMEFYSKTHMAYAVSHVEYWDGHDNEGYIVAILGNKVEGYTTLSDLHTHLKNLGAEHSFPDYTPHITLCTGIKKSYTPQAVQAMLAKMNIRIKLDKPVVALGKFYVEEIK